LKQETRPSENTPAVGNDAALREELGALAERLFSSPQKQAALISRVLEMYARAQGRDFLVVHSPGGWGNTPFEGLLEWERSIVNGLLLALQKLGYSTAMAQYFRSGKSHFGHMPDVGRDIRFFNWNVSPRADLMAEVIGFLAEHLPQTRIILVGASQGAAFNNGVMQRVGDQGRVYSIELGTFFPYLRHRTITPRTLALDNNGLMRDPMVDRDLWVGFKSYVRGFRIWIRLRFQGKPAKYTHLTNTPGHEYHWSYPNVGPTITTFLTERFGQKTNAEKKR